MTSPATRSRVPASIPSAKGRLVVLLVSALVWGFGGAGCGVQEGQEKVDSAREAEKQMEERQQDVEEKLKEAGQQVEEGH